MNRFEIKEDFLVNGKKTKIISGAIHYFRLTEKQWEDSLYNLKALGANTVETYIPWNIHEPFEGEFDFGGMKNVEGFIQKAAEFDLMVILRPSVYICAEWEFGGLPAWLLNSPGMRVRSTCPLFMEKVRNYLCHLIPKLVPYQVTNGGPVIMMQIENEYGSYGMEKEYLYQTKIIMEELGVDVPLFTADGADPEFLDSGTLIDEGVFVTGNFGSHSKENVQHLQNFFDQHGKKWPIMCMEFWDGWFNRWGEEIIRRDAEELAKDVKEMLELGSINFYMFHGGTNFGFYNGCSARGMKDLPQITSYDYDALLDEAGNPTPKYFAVQKVIKEVCPDVWQTEPRIKTLANYGKVQVKAAVSLFETLADIADVQESIYPLTMEEMGSGLGYSLYEIEIKNYHRENKFKLIGASDRAQVFLDNVLYATVNQEEVVDFGVVKGRSDKETLNVKVLIENNGRVNYGYKLMMHTQRKGIREGIMHNMNYQLGYKQFALDMSKEQLEKVDYSKKFVTGHPTFYKFEIEVSTAIDTYIDCSKFGKGFVAVNGINLGRYWNIGPVGSLYCPKEFLKEGVNEIVVFETEGVLVESIELINKPVYISICDK